MTAIDERPDLRPVGASQAQLPEAPAVDDARAGAEFFGGDVWMPGDLANAQRLARDIIERQDVAELYQVKSRAEHDKELELAEAERAGDRELRQLELNGRLERRRAEIKAEIAAQKAAADIEAKIRKLEHDDELGAAQARGLMRRLTSSASYMASQIRARKWSLALTAAPAIFAVLIGAAQVQDTLAGLMDFGPANPLFWLFFVVEPLATFPLISILLAQATDNGATAERIEDHVKGLRFVWRRAMNLSFFMNEVLALLFSVLLNVVPHLLAGESLGRSLVWLFVPAAIVCNLSLMPALNRAFGERILALKEQAALEDPMGALGSAAEWFRRVRVIKAADTRGELTGDRTASGRASNRGIEKYMRRTEGRVARGTANGVGLAIDILDGTVE